MSSDVIIEAHELSKCYHVYEKPSHRLMQMFARGHKQYYREFWALRNLSFTIRKGETVGIVGRNGSGKSTLLQIICGTTTPSSGTVRTHGRIAALLELGSGFNPEFTGRENIYMNAAILGLSREETDERFSDIVEFAGIGDFIDRPVKTYSSGMMVRLAFAVQAQTSPDILIVDEALAVGDVKFQAKCFERIRQLKERGTTILLVTHSSEQIVSHCSRAFLIDGGELLEAGEPRHIVNRYLDILFGRGGDKALAAPDEAAAGKVPGPESGELVSHLSFGDDLFSTRPGYNPHEYRWGDGAVSILDYCLVSNSEFHPSSVQTGDKIKLGFSIRFNASLFRPILGITVKTKEGITVYGANSETLKVEDLLDTGASGSYVYVEVSFNCRLAPGDYFVSVGVATKRETEIVPHDRRYDAIHLQVAPTTSFFGLVNMEMALKASKA